MRTSKAEPNQAGVESSPPSSPVVTAAESSVASTAIDSSLKRDILKSMVQIAVRQTRSYQQSYAGTYQASAFLVDKTRGLFLTAGHAVQGPCEGYIISHNDERCDFKIRYKDPEHDYAILQCPPAELGSLDLESLTLKPEAAVVGSHVYLIGNDSGEKVNILRGTISRLDTTSPTHYDSNVELIQASAAGKGGCSGGPLLTLEGEAIGICVSGHNSSHLDWFFPLHCPLQVLENIKREQPVVRGTLHTVWRRVPFYECRQIGLSRAKQAEINTDKNGLLVATMIIPETEAFEFLRVNDILISINSKVVVDFSDLENILNFNVGRKIQIEVIRFQKTHIFELVVHDLFALTPTRILTDSGATFHNVPYRTAVCWRVPLKGLYVADSTSTYRLGDNSRDYIISSINGHATPNVIEGEKTLIKFADRERVTVRYSHATRNSRQETMQITLDRHWEQPSLTIFNPDTGEWDYSNVKTQEKTSQEVSEPALPNHKAISPKTPVLSEIKRRFVQLTWTAPFVCLDENTDAKQSGFGFILSRGLILVEKAVCPHDLCDIYIDIDGREVLGTIVHMDHRQNWILVRYDAAETSTETLDTIDLATTYPLEFDPVTFLGIDDSDTFHTTKSRVTGSLIADFSSPLHHAEAIDVVQIDSDIAQTCLLGVIMNETQQISGFWIVSRNNNSYILPTVSIAPVVYQVLAGLSPMGRPKLNFRCEMISPKDARIMGVKDEYINHGISINGAQHRFFSVRRTTLRAADYIQHSDIFLRINGKPITKYIDFDAFDDTEHETVELGLVRDGKEIVIDYPLQLAADAMTDRVTSIFGMILQAPYTDLKYITREIYSELIYMSTAAGSPGQHTAIMYGNFVTGVNGNRVYDLGSFLDEISQILEETDFTIQSTDWNGKEYSDIVRKSSRAFGSYEFIKKNGKWEKMSLDLRTRASEKDLVILPHKED
ncbi:hypothetical protein BGW36DRAFT_393443 [Talaromyces proteolyticus]|uniref:Pro-apoptotic serine protease NMA111 n=1 Tax=Talaromyces proteolyticus TaxID=1131652 RepID=A0AAD4Q6S2_9EURO|nr:uncharacterized protein BGW36DRAFT_393443 [Talaromyces proteolyticus]KAH8706001.1 hypothetical protein BGW36DRAFT_393443 [Talaromyces proteolyticus]